MRAAFRTILFVGLSMIGLMGQAQAQNQTAIFAGGCFWCVESDFESVPGVVNAVTGYIGGKGTTASYKAVSKGGTGHYEAVKITFDPTKVSFDALVHKFWRTVDPTDAGGQFCDRGDSYRTAIFAMSEKQKEIANQSKKQAQNELGQKVVTPILTASKFYVAEDYHQNYYESDKKVLTRFGLIKRKVAYKKYRKSCGRDARVNALWGNAAGQLGG